MLKLIVFAYVLCSYSVLFCLCLIKIKFNRISTHHLIAYVGQSKEKYPMTIDLMNQTTWLVPNSHNDTSIITESNIINDDIRIQMGFNHFKGKEIVTSFGFEEDSSIIIDSLNIYCFTNIPKVYLSSSGHIGLVFRYEDEQYSIIHQYYKQGFINHLSFSMVFSLGYTYLYLGGIPQESIENKYHSYCNVNQESIYWDCSIQAISYEIDGQVVSLGIENDIKSSGNIARINSLENVIYAPQSFMDELFMKYFDNISNNKLCDFTDYKNTKQLYCYTQRNKDVGKLSFIINNYVYSFAITSFWMCDIDFCFFEMVQNPYGDYWLLGTRFYYNMDLHFDYEGKAIHFYSKNGVILFTNKLYNTQYLLCFLFMILVFGVGILIIVKKSLIRFAFY